MLEVYLPGADIDHAGALDAAVIVDQVRRLADGAYRIQGHLAGALARAAGGAGFHVVHVDVGTGFQGDVLAGAIGYGPHVQGGEIAAGADLHRPVRRHHRIHHQGVHLVQNDVPGYGGDRCYPVGEHVQGDGAFGFHVDIVGDEDRTEVRRHFHGGQIDEAGGAVNTAYYRERTSGGDGDVPRRVEALEAAYEPVQGKVIRQLHIDVLLRPEDKLRGLDACHLDINVPGIFRGFHDLAGGFVVSVGQDLPGAVGGHDELRYRAVDVTAYKYVGVRHDLQPLGGGDGGIQCDGAAVLKNDALRGQCAGQPRGLFVSGIEIEVVAGPVVHEDRRGEESVRLQDPPGAQRDTRTRLHGVPVLRIQHCQVPVHAGQPDHAVGVVGNDPVDFHGFSGLNGH